MRISDWSSDVCSSGLRCLVTNHPLPQKPLEAACADRGDGRLRTSRQLDDEGLSGIVALEAVDFGRAGIPGATIDAECPMPVTERKIVEVRSACAIGRDLVLRFALRAKVADRKIGRAHV